MAWPPALPGGHDLTTLALRELVGGPWTTLPLSNGCTQYGGPYAGPGYRKVGDLVCLRGLVKIPNVAWPALTIIAVLPVGLRPVLYIRLPAIALKGGADASVPIEIRSDDGALYSNTVLDSNGYCFLDGIFFSVTT